MRCGPKWCGALTFVGKLKSGSARALVVGGLFTSAFLGQVLLAPVASAHEMTGPAYIAALDPAPIQNAQPPSPQSQNGQYRDNQFQNDQTLAPNAPSAQAGAGQVAAPQAIGGAVPPQIKRWQPLILKYSQQYHVDPNFIAAIMMSESEGNPDATSPVGAVGLMQVMGGSYDPDTNVHQGVQLLASLTQRFGSDLELVAAAYNAGDGAVVAYHGIPPYPETQLYVFSVLNRYYLYVSG